MRAKMFSQTRRRRVGLFFGVAGGSPGLYNEAFNMVEL